MIKGMIPTLPTIRLPCDLRKQNTIGLPNLRVFESQQIAIFVPTFEASPVI